MGRGSGVLLLPPDLQGTPRLIMGDADRLCGVLLNLYTNAAKFTKRGCISLRARVVDAQPVPVRCARAMCTSSTRSKSSFLNIFHISFLCVACYFLQHCAMFQ